MNENSAGWLGTPGPIGDSLTELLLQGARGLTEKAVEGRWCINRMRAIFLFLSVFSRQNNPAGDGNGHAEGGHDIQGGHPDMHLGDLGFEKARGQTTTEQLLEAIHGIFSEAAAMIADRPFPGRQPVSRDGG